MTNPKAANLLQHEAGEDDVDLYGGIAVLGFVNGHLFLSSATKICPNFSNQTTTFLEKKTDLFLPTYKSWKKVGEVCVAMEEAPGDF